MHRILPQTDDYEVVMTLRIDRSLCEDTPDDDYNNYEDIVDAIPFFMKEAVHEVSSLILYPNCVFIKDIHAFKIQTPADKAAEAYLLGG